MTLALLVSVVITTNIKTSNENLSSNIFVNQVILKIIYNNIENKFKIRHGLKAKWHTDAEKYGECIDYKNEKLVRGFRIQDSWICAQISIIDFNKN